MAMAVRAKNTHYRMCEIQRRHWIALGQRHGVVTPDGRGTGHVLDDLAERASQVAEAVRDRLPAGFPAAVADAILDGMQQAAKKLTR